MAEIKITQEDLRAAESFLVGYLSEKIPEASFERGSAMRDFMVSGFAYIFAYLKYEVSFSRMRQSLLRIRELSDVDDIAQAADELLSNWFLSRKSGQLARVTARLHFLERRPYNIDLGTRFWRTSVTAFYIDGETNPYAISEDQLYPVYDTTGELVDYVVDVPLKSSRIGEGYNIAPGRFIRVDAVGGLPFLTFVEHLAMSSGGKDVESTDELLTRAQTAITVRNLINNRSCDAVLQQEFPEILNTLTVGMGEEEMVRDRRTEIASHITLHTGGCYDTFVELPLQTVEDTGVVGGYFARADGVANIFRDPALTHGLGGVPGVPFTALVDPGDVIHIISGILGAPRAFQILSVTDHELEISIAVPFGEASDETENTVTYCAGAISPVFGDKIPSRDAAATDVVGLENVPFGTSRHIRSPGRILLTGRPVQDIEWVELLDPPGTMDQMVDPTTGTLLFPIRVNFNPVGPMAEPLLNQYQVRVRNPASSQSNLAVTEINVGLETDPSFFDGHTLRVRYRTSAGFANVHAFVTNRDHRVKAANHLVRARHPVWIEAVIPYKMRVTLADAVIDEEEASQILAEYINNFDPNDDLDMSDLATTFRNAYPDIGVVYPFTIFYRLMSPDGQEVLFSTEDAVSIFMTETNGVAVENSTDIVVPQVLIDQGITVINDASSLREWYKLYGISDRTIKFRCDEGAITFVRRG